jgi:hypothetical protein
MPLVASNVAPPKKVTPKPTPAPSKKTETDVSKIQKEREDGLNGFFQVFSAISIMTGNWADAGAYTMHGPNVSRETAVLGGKYERVGNALDALSQVGPFTAILGAAMPLILQIAANHNRIPASKMASLGVVNPEILESQMKMEAQRQEMEARAAMKAESDAMTEMQKEWDELRKEPVPA